MTIDHLPAASEMDDSASETKSAIARDIKHTMDDLMWRSFAMGATVLKQYEMTLQQALALGAIVRLGPDVDMGSISEATLLAPSTTTSVVDRLVQRGFASRSPHPTDRRRVLVNATRNGEYLAREIEEQDLNAFLWMSRQLSNHDLDMIHSAFRHLLKELVSLKPGDFAPGARHARRSSPPKSSG